MKWLRGGEKRNLNNLGKGKETIKVPKGWFGAISTLLKSSLRTVTAISHQCREIIMKK